MKKILKILNSYFEDSDFATYSEGGKNLYETIDFPFGLISNTEYGFIIHFSLDAPPYLIFEVTRALKDIDIKIYDSDVYMNEEGVFFDEEAFKNYAQDLAWIYLDDTDSSIN